MLHSKLYGIILLMLILRKKNMVQLILEIWFTYLEIKSFLKNNIMISNFDKTIIYCCQYMICSFNNIFVDAEAFVIFFLCRLKLLSLCKLEFSNIPFFLSKEFSNN